jgi:N-acetylglucosaminyldiphosphoundecaprenol N-acetyl-beta-D-mannosaminyltransferase
MIVKPAVNSVDLLGVRIDDLPVETLVEQITRYVQNQEKAIISNVNIHAMNLAYKLADFRQFLCDCEIVFCDGFGVMLGARMAGGNLHYRYTPPDWIPLLCEECVSNDLSMYFLGAREGVAKQAANNLQASFPRLRILGTRHGYFDKSPGSLETQIMIQEINEQRPDILLVGFGMPMQEFWLRDNWSELDVGVALPVGAFFDYAAGAKRRAPNWITDSGFEWLGRLIVEPDRLWQRYIIGNPLFFWRILKQKFKK